MNYRYRKVSMFDLAEAQEIFEGRAKTRKSHFKLILGFLILALALCLFR